MDVLKYLINVFIINYEFIVKIIDIKFGTTKKEL